MNDTNTSTIASSFKPRDYRQARYAGNLGDADLPLPTTDFLTTDEKED